MRGVTVGGGYRGLNMGNTQKGQSEDCPDTSVLFCIIRQILLCNLFDWNIVNVDFVFADEKQEQVQRAFKYGQLYKHFPRRTQNSVFWREFLHNQYDKNLTFAPRLSEFSRLEPSFTEILYSTAQELPTRVHKE